MGKLNRTIELTGASGRKYTFEIYTADTEWRADFPCVYYVSKRIVTGTNGTHTAIYIGQCECIKTRHVDHHKQECFNRLDANMISVHHEANEKTRLAIEADLVKAYSPPCNG